MTRTQGIQEKGALYEEMQITKNQNCFLQCNGWAERLNEANSEEQEKITQLHAVLTQTKQLKNLFPPF